MLIGVSSQNFKTITGHAGKARRFLLYEKTEQGAPVEVERLDLPKDMSMHEFRGDSHPLDRLSILVTSGCGEGFMQRMGAWGVRVITTSETDIQKVVQALFEDKPLPSATPHDH